MRAISVCVLAALVWSAAPGTAEAQEPPADVARARELFVQASELRDRGDLRGALEKFEAAHTLAVNPITTFELARTYATLGMLVEARDAYASIARMPAQAGETERATEARRDGSAAVEELQRRITLGEGESRETKLAVTAAAPAPATELEPKAWAPSPTPDAGGNHLGPFAYAGFGVGAAGFVVGTVLAGVSLSKAASISLDCGTTACVQDGKDASQSARVFGVAAVVSYTLAAAGVGVGVADILLYKPGRSTESDHALRAWIGVGAAGLGGSF
jgi:hypothetical protein